jgi:hypothetical protein
MKGPVMSYWSRQRTIGIGLVVASAACTYMAWRNRAADSFGAFEIWGVIAIVTLIGAARILRPDWASRPTSVRGQLLFWAVFVALGVGIWFVTERALMGKSSL